MRLFRDPRRPLLLYEPERDPESDGAGAQRDNVGRPVAVYAFRAEPGAVGLDDGVRVEHGAEEEVEDIARDHGGEGHGAPVLAQAVDAE